MIKVQLTKSQLDKLNRANVEEAQTRQNFNLAQQLAVKAANHKQDISDMILEAHNIDKSSIPKNATFNVSPDGVLTLIEENASKRIRETVKKSPGKKK